MELVYSNFSLTICLYLYADINGCAVETVTCSSDAKCINISGRFVCVCNDGFVGDGFKCTGVET